MDDFIWQDPQEKIWGFHVHQELPEHEFDRALVIQEECARFLHAYGVHIDADDAIRPGYGPHLNYMWELRVESPQEDILNKLGLAISFMAINRFGLSGYIHPMMQDRSLQGIAHLHDEGRTNQSNVLWFSYAVPQRQDFFHNPPLDVNGEVVDTRTKRVLSWRDKTALQLCGKASMRDCIFQDPHLAIRFGFHIHMDFTPTEKELALTIYDNFMHYLLTHNLNPTSTRIYGPGENGPHVQGGWEVKFETQDTNVLRYIGIAVGWLMCNRRNMSIFMHPVTWLPGDVPEELKAHEKYSMFIGALPPLDLNFFRDQIDEHIVAQRNS